MIIILRMNPTNEIGRPCRRFDSRNSRKRTREGDARSGSAGRRCDGSDAPSLVLVRTERAPEWREDRGGESTVRRYPCPPAPRASDLDRLWQIESTTCSSFFACVRIASGVGGRQLLSGCLLFRSPFGSRRSANDQPRHPAAHCIRVAARAATDPFEICTAVV